MLGARERDFLRASGCGVKVTTSWLNVGVKFTIVWLSSMSAAVCAAEVAMLPASQACHLFARVNKQIDSTQHAVACEFESFPSQGSSQVDRASNQARHPLTDSALQQERCLLPHACIPTLQP